MKNNNSNSVIRLRPDLLSLNFPQNMIKLESEVMPAIVHDDVLDETHPEVLSSI